MKMHVVLKRVLAGILTVSLAGGWSIEAGAEGAEKQSQDFVYEAVLEYTNSLYDAAAPEEWIVYSECEGYGTVAESDETISFTSFSEAVNYLRTEMVNRKNEVSFQLSGSDVEELDEEGIKQQAVDLVSGAMAHTEGCSGREGDALYCDFAKYSCRMSYNVSRGIVIYEYQLEYKTTLEEEQMLTEAVNSALAEMNLGDKLPIEKITTIHDYICDHVDYDYESGEDNLKRYTAYAALCEGKAVCQGYAVLFYRFCKEAGIPVRIITGTGNGGPHAWNIVKLGNVYYNMDVTWDGQSSSTLHTYFMKNEADFTDHIRGDSFATEAFYQDYPMAEQSYNESTVSQVKYGDVNLDDSVDANDLTALARILGGLASWSGENQRTAADCNRDGMQDANDLTTLARYLGGLISEL